MIGTWKKYIYIFLNSLTAFLGKLFYPLQDTVAVLIIMASLQRAGDKSYSVDRSIVLYEECYRWRKEGVLNILRKIGQCIGPRKQSPSFKKSVELSH